MLRIALLVAFVFQQAPSAAGPSLQGIVLTTNGDPLNKVSVELRAEGSSTPIASMTTEEDGRYVFWNVPPGRYRIVATRPGYARAEYGQRGIYGAGQAVTLAARQQFTNLLISMTQAGSISGRIQNAAGQAVGNVMVQALKESYPEGYREFEVVQSALTNDLGEYRFFWLAPGRYYVGVGVGSGNTLIMNPDGPDTGVYGIGNTSSGGPGLAGGPPPSLSRTLPGLMRGALPPTQVFVPTYYPGTAETQRAVAIDVRPADDVRGIDLVYSPVPARRVSGFVIGLPPGTPAQVSLLSMTHAEQGLLNPQPRSASATSDPNTGAFSVAGLGPGAYMLIATTTTGLTARTPVEIFDRDVESLTIRVGTGFNISGRLVIEGVAGAIPAGLRIDLRPDPPAKGIAGAQSVQPGGFISRVSIGDLLPSAIVAPDGTFRITNAAAGKYKVFVTPILSPPKTPVPAIAAGLQNAYVKSIGFGNVDVLNGGLDLDRQPEGQMEIVVGLTRGAVEGRVVSVGQTSSAGATVALLPDLARRSRLDLYRAVTADDTGQFQIASIPPGDYKVFAWGNVEPGVWMNPDFVKAYEDQGIAVRVREGATASTTVTMIP